MGSNVAELGKIETIMPSGCGGYVTHNIRRCSSCGRHFLTSFEDHFLHGPAAGVFEIDQAEAQDTVAWLGQCPDIHNRTCDCQVHQEAYFLHLKTQGQKRYVMAVLE